ncbi:sensor histidine kinase [Arthrobacter humicola]
MLARCTSIFALVLYALSVPDIASQIPMHNAVWDLLFMAGIPAAVLWTMFIRRSITWLKISTGTAACLMIASFLMWHVGLIGDGSQVESRPWSWGVAGVGIALAAIAARVWAAAAYGTLFCVLIVLVPLTTAGNTRAWHEAAQDALLTAALGVVIIAPITALRRAASTSDRAAIAAVGSFGAAALSEAIRVERSRLDALIHDTVMATLIVAGQARTPEVMEAAQKAAGEALAHLDILLDDDAPDGARISANELVSRIRSATAGHDPRIAFRCQTDVPPSIPLTAARALIQAATEAVRNSSLHAPNATAAIAVACQGTTTAPEVTIDIVDNGPGFDTALIPPQRLGVRVSILQRMQEAGGQAQVISSPAAGTVVNLKWSAPVGNG